MRALCDRGQAPLCPPDLLRLGADPFGDGVRHLCGAGIFATGVRHPSVPGLG